jgi:hypothetical protein
MIHSFVVYAFVDRRYILRHFVHLHGSKRSLKGLLGKLLYILPSFCVVQYRLVACLDCLRLQPWAHISFISVTSFLQGQASYLLQPIHQGCRELETFLVRIVQLFRENLVDDPIIACV